MAGAEALVDSVLAVRAPSAWIDTEPALAKVAQEAPALKEAMDVPEKAEPAEMASAQAGRLLRALAHDSCALARTGPGRGRGDLRRVESGDEGGGRRHASPLFWARRDIYRERKRRES